MSDLSPFLNTWVMFAVFQSRGSLPSAMNYFKSIHSEDASSFAHSFIIIGGKLSGEKSQQRQKAKLFLGTTMLIACTKMNPLPPPPPQMLDLMSKTMKKLTKTVFRWPFWRLDTCDKSPLNPGNNKKAIFIATRDTVILTLFCSVDICTYGSWTGKWCSMAQLSRSAA